MTTPANGQTTTVTKRPAISTTKPDAKPAAPTPPDHRTTALQAAVALHRGRAITKTDDVLTMSQAFLDFLEGGK